VHISKDFLRQLLTKEYATTLRVLRAFPADRGDFAPHERSNTALRLAQTFVFEMFLLNRDAFGKPLADDAFSSYSPPDLAAAIADFERESASTLANLEAFPEEDLQREVSFAGKTFWIGEYILMMLFDQIHHRGQLTVYVRMAGGKVPSIYGPSADDPSTNL
jgi:uncharacterized damage-inducible protein DinB